MNHPGRRTQGRHKFNRFNNLESFAMINTVLRNPFDSVEREEKLKRSDQCVYVHVYIDICVPVYAYTYFDLSMRADMHALQHIFAYMHASTTIANTHMHIAQASAQVAKGFWSGHIGSTHIYVHIFAC